MTLAGKSPSELFDLLNNIAPNSNTLAGSISQFQGSSLDGKTEILNRDIFYKILENYLLNPSEISKKVTGNERGNMTFLTASKKI